VAGYPFDELDRRHMCLVGTPPECQMQLAVRSRPQVSEDAGQRHLIGWPGGFRVATVDKADVIGEHVKTARKRSAARDKKQTQFVDAIAQGNRVIKIAFTAPRARSRTIQLKRRGR